jgi:hypothetical protein
MFNKKEWQYISSWSKKIKAINLLGGKCKCCDEDRPWLLSFHHKDPNEKEISINDIRNYRWSEIEKEISKCILICERCHREIHNKNVKTIHTTSKQFCLCYVNVFCCQQCGYDKYTGALEFHHENSDSKLFDISKKNIRTIESLTIEIKNEIDKCSVYCSNCHQDLHFDKEKFERSREQIYQYDVKEKQKPLDRQKVIDMFNSGMKQVDIAKQLKCTKSTICQILGGIKRK